MSQNFSRSLHETIGNRFRGKERIKGEIVGEWSTSWNFERRFPLNRNPMETSLRRLGRNSTSTKGRTPLRRYDPPQNASGKENPSSPVSKVNGVEVKELARIHSGQDGSPPFLPTCFNNNGSPFISFKHLPLSWFNPFCIVQCNYIWFFFILYIITYIFWNKKILKKTCVITFRFIIRLISMLIREYVEDNKYQKLF